MDIDGLYLNSLNSFCCRSEVALSNRVETTLRLNEKADCKEETRQAGTVKW